MSASIGDFLELFDKWAKFDLAEDWDNSGLQVGDRGRVVQKVLIALDPSMSTIEKARELRADLIVTHHPLIFNPLKCFEQTRVIPSRIERLIKYQIGLISLHTNLDSAEGGVNDVLAEAIGLKNLSPLVPAEKGPFGAGMGRVGSLDREWELEEYCEFVARRLNCFLLKVQGDFRSKISKVALCSGAGSSLWPNVQELGVDLYLTGEIKHSVFIEARELGICLIDAGHFHTEWPVLHALRDFLIKNARECGWDLKIDIFDEEPIPFRGFLPSNWDQALAGANIFNSKEKVLKRSRH